MKKRGVALFFFIALFLLVSCSREGPCPAGQRKEDDGKITEQATETDTKKQAKTMFDQILFESIPGLERVMNTLVSERILAGNFCKNYTSEYAVCTVTVLRIDKSGCQSEKGTYLPVRIRLDSIIDRTPSFSLKEGDTEEVAERTAWFKTDAGFTVNYWEGSIPITEEDAQYIILLYEKASAGAEDPFGDLKYMAEALTIPICRTGDLTDSQIYERMDLPDDVVLCSKDLIAHFFGT